ncbi:MAG TPA: 5-deoxy-glucuronate isomerase [Polyangiaceae bacterium]|nr:5-deoxy-glucuronate isomerase [Polyangiaceae bacterium]
MTSQRLDPKTLVVRGTAAERGRKTWVAPDQSPCQHLCYGRILLDSSTPKLRFETHARETALICLSGTCTVKVGSRSETLEQYDALYVPRGSLVEISTWSQVDLVECGSEVDGDYPLQVVRYADVLKDPALHFTTGSEATTRTLNILIGKNVQAGRIVAGFTRSAPGHWTSWPPHEHAELLEELYLFFDMPSPAFGVQFVYTDAGDPELAAVVRDGDAVLMPRGYHPNVSVPGHAINFVWLMAARREVQDRVFGVVNVQPEFKQGGSGLEASRR